MMGGSKPFDGALIKGTADRREVNGREFRERVPPSWPWAAPSRGPAIRSGCQKKSRRVRIRASLETGRAISAVVAQQLYTLWVGGSNPSSPTILCRTISAVQLTRIGYVKPLIEAGC